MTNATKYLIYTIAIGEKFHGLARMFVNSLLHTGKWKHDLIVLSDVESIAGLPKTAKVISLQNLDWNLDINLRFNGTWRPEICYKSIIKHYIDINRYKYLLYLDSDILINSHRLNMLVDKASDTGNICVMEDRISVKNNNRVTGRYELSESEKIKWANVAINAGVVGFPGNDFGEEFLLNWESKRSNHPKGDFFSDQATLYALLLRNYQGQWQYIGDTIHGRQLKTYSQTIIHFTQFKDNLMEKYYKQMLKL